MQAFSYLFNKSLLWPSCAPLPSALFVEPFFELWCM